MDKPFDQTSGDAAPPCAERVWTDFLAVLDTLPPTTRAVFLLHRLFDASFADIERTTGVHRDDCAQHLEAARRALVDAARAQSESSQEHKQ